MAEEPRLPPLRRSKRSRNEGMGLYSAPPSSLATSSDPAWFSSDDDPAIENYTEGRRKRRFQGSWFSPHPKTSSRVMLRQYDSGVWVDSDPPHLDNIPEETVPFQSNVAFIRPPVCRDSKSEAELIAAAKVRDCVENGVEEVELMQLGLDTLSDEIVLPLQMLACIPTVEKGLPFQHRDPSLQFYLGLNKLREIPPALFTLTHLSVLSLLGNSLAELTPAIANLTNLQALNISRNKLRYLPGELLDLLNPTSKLKQLVLYPNPFFRPRLLQSCLNEGHNLDAIPETLPEHYQGYVTRIRARSPVHYKDSSGLTFSAFRVPDEHEDSVVLDTEPLNSLPLSPDRVASSTARSGRVPSLVELCLNAACKSSQLQNIAELLSKDANMPAYMHHVLKKAIKSKQNGGRHCCICNRSMLISRTSWIEWWEIATVSTTDTDIRLEPFVTDPDERVVPFLRQGCSWKCVPAKVDKSEWVVTPY